MASDINTKLRGKKTAHNLEIITKVIGIKVINNVEAITTIKNMQNSVHINFSIDFLILTLASSVSPEPKKFSLDQNIISSSLGIS